MVGQMAGQLLKERKYIERKRVINQGERGRELICSLILITERLLLKPVPDYDF